MPFSSLEPISNASEAPIGTNAVILEIGGRTAGIVTLMADEFVFFASGRRFSALDRQSFRSIGQVERALQRLLHKRRHTSALPA